MFEHKIQLVMDKVDALRTQVNDHWQVPKEEALFLAQLVRIGRFKSLCEIGTSYGYSTLHLTAAASEHGGHVHTLDINPRKTEHATAHLTEAGLLNSVTLHTGDARELLKNLQPQEPFDFAFIDATKEQSMGYLDALTPRLAQRALLVTDNTRTHAEELAGFVTHLRSLPGAKSTHVNVGNGVELTLWDR
ncbi:MAG: methyltransferase domain-containing protein [Phycisphaera sp.]|nr:methyltransferase domain-containing protein [Phycisphaera sp.]